MPIDYDIIEDKKIVVAKGSGVVTGADVISHLDRGWPRMPDILRL